MHVMHICIIYCSYNYTCLSLLLFLIYCCRLSLGLSLMVFPIASLVNTRDALTALGILQVVHKESSQQNLESSDEIVTNVDGNLSHFTSNHHPC